MRSASISDIAVWIENIQPPQDSYELPKKRRVAQTDRDQTPRPPKRVRDLDDALQFPPPSLTKSASSDAVSEAFEAESHQSGRLSPVKQIQLLEDFEEQPVVFCNFDDDVDGAEPEDVVLMRRAMQRFADGIGVLGYGNVDAVVSALPPMDRMRFQYPWANDLEQRCVFGSTPSTAQVLGIVDTARGYGRGPGVSEDEWNSEIQHPLLELAYSTCKNSQSLVIFNVKTARIEPASLARSALPGRAVDYVVALKPDSAIDQAWHRLRPLPGVSGPMKSWTDGKPQIAIWTDAWLKRLALIRGTPNRPWPALPLPIVQGHDWHLLIVSRNDHKMTVWEQIAIGSMRSCFDAMKVVAALHWLLDWAERVW
ncbi:hypothetical protein BDY21DRAFT_388301 [Lineolata rhizophorae]|uniref:PD-(D/E)XK nuclease-like domain-containing protein n=1 Tax=Lineolata rhizophorae TaxID=578093 RepID=A0A6A6NMV9_9PEZI|nr:hypothetical protein BDY21DRAFT_388301 [Lineolata rhizophorae]